MAGSANRSGLPSKASSVIQCDLQLEEMQICGLSGKLSSLESADTFAS